jgi:hypothetical protein
MAARQADDIAARQIAVAVPQDLQILRSIMRELVGLYFQ